MRGFWSMRGQQSNEIGAGVGAPQGSNRAVKGCSAAFFQLGFRFPATYSRPTIPVIGHLPGIEDFLMITTKGLTATLAAFAMLACMASAANAAQCGNGPGGFEVWKQ